MDSRSRLEIQGRFELALLFIADGQTDEAIKELREVVRALPDAGPAHGRLGVLLAEKGCLDEAVVEFRAALTADWADAGAHFQLAVAQDKLGRRAEALAAFESFLAQPGAGDTEHAAFARRRAAELRGAEPAPAVAGPAGAKPEERRKGGLAFLGWDKDKRSLSGAAAFLRGWVSQGLAGWSWGPGPLLAGGGLIGLVAVVGIARLAGREGPTGAPKSAAPSPGLSGEFERRGRDSAEPREGPESAAADSSIDLLFTANKVAKPAAQEAPVSPEPATAPAQEPSPAPAPAHHAPARSQSPSPRPVLERVDGVAGAGFGGGFSRSLSAPGQGGHRPSAPALSGFGGNGAAEAAAREMMSPLLRRKVGDRNVTANKAMGQLKFAGQQSSKALEAGSAGKAAAFTGDAFSQTDSGAEGGKTRASGSKNRAKALIGQAEAGPDDGNAACAKDKVRVKGIGCQGQNALPDQEDREAGWTAGKAAGCPEGTVSAPGGGCRPVGELEGKNVTAYQKDVDRAKELADEARRLGSDTMTGGWGERRKKAKRLAEESAEIGKKIKKADGQAGQGELIEHLGGGAWFHNKGNQETVKRDGEKKQKAIEAEMDQKASKAAKKESESGFR